MMISASAVTTSLPREPAQPVAQQVATPPKSAAGMQQAELAEATRNKAEPAQAQAALAEINQTMQMASIGVRFEFDKEAETMIAKVVDVETGVLIRQMPSAEVVHISKVLGKLQGLLVRQEV